MIGREKLIDDFKRLAKENKLSHAYLFFGGDKNAHREKFLFSLSLANFLENRLFEEPLQLLQETLIISSLNNNGEDVSVKETIGIDNIRDLKNFLWQKPTNSSRRVAIIKEAENMTLQAQNAALKIIEEPPEASLIIFIAGTIENLLPTLTSRMQKIYFPSAKMEVKMERLSPESWLNENEIDDFFEDLILNLERDKIKNSRKIKEVLTRLTLMKQFNTNKKLQWRSLDF